LWGTGLNEYLSAIGQHIRAFFSKDDKGRFCAPITFTQEEIAATIGVARETVTRLVAAFQA
jgi:hypothetical protein